jgi:hypothetical protein
MAWKKLLNLSWPLYPSQTTSPASERPERLADQTPQAAETVCLDADGGASLVKLFLTILPKAGCSACLSRRRARDRLDTRSMEHMSQPGPCGAVRRDRLKREAPYAS